ncbi:PhnB protein [Microbacterium phyllosphaerae]|uniref:PhnB protein n=1 Tax=Microbacterium phyllosphaerae TaxID=124798 RepID=A0ABS4WU16_9MICO|nr:VOC family protein [Microbacterium phyllosphaerae]MBP2379675.1 PhnB protein [Microbacterium phyllosphaerae]MCS3443915.1 PhnB protein [Microbacterium phyllosphaerae]
MSGLTPYLLFPGNAAEALEHYRAVFGGDLQLLDYAAAGRHDGPGDAVAHGQLSGPVELAGADAGADDDAVQMSGMFLSLLGTADATTLTSWFDQLSSGGRVIDALQKRPWGDYDGTLIDRYGIRWLIGFHDED